jgi:hypothetical protein
MRRREMAMGEMDLHELGRAQSRAGLCRRAGQNQRREGEHLQSMCKRPPLQVAGCVVVVEVPGGCARGCGLGKARAGREEG